MDTSQQHLNVWSSSVNVSTSSPLIATTPSTLLLPAATVPAVVATQAIIANDAPPPLPTYHFVEGSLPRAAFPDKNGSDAQQQQQLQQQRQHQAHHHLRQYAVDQQLFLDGDIANLSESGSGSKFGNNNNNNTITTNNTQTLGSPQSGILLHSPTALLATPFVGVQQPNFYVNNNSTTTPTSASVASSAAGLVTSFAPPIASPATPPGLQQASSSMFSSSGSPGTSLNVATSGTFSASGTGQGVEDEQLSSTNIFVSHLPAFVDDVALRNLFSRFGPILSSVVMRDIYSGVSRGIAFVEFENETSASDAIASLDKLVMEDKTISVQRGKRFSRGAPTSRVFIRNIPKAVSEAELYDVCSKFGDVSWLSLHADSMRHAGVAGSSGAGSSSDAAAMMALESQLMSTNTTTGGASSSSTTTTAGGKQDRNIAFVTFASKEAASAAAVALHNASPFAGADGVPLLTKVVLDNLPPRRQRKASAAPTTTTNHHHQHQQQQQQNHRQMQPQLHQPSPYGSVAAPPQMFLPQHLLSHHHHQFQRALHSPLTPFNVFHPPQQQQQQQQQGQLHHHSLPNLQGSPQQQHHMHQLHHHQQHAGNFLFLPTDGTTMGTPQLMHNPAPMQLVPQHHQHHHQMNQQQLHPSSTAASSASALLMTSPPSHQFVFATMPQGGQQQQQQFHPLQSSGSGVGGGPSSSMTHMQGGGAAAMQPASPFQYASPFHSSNGGASFVPIQQQVSDGSSWSSSMMLDPMQHQQQQQQLFHGSTSGASPSSGGVGGGNNPAAMILSPPHTTEVVSMPPAQHMMYWNASSLM